MGLAAPDARNPQTTPPGIVIVMFARFSAAVLPTLCAQAPGERIHSGKPAGASNSGISIRSPGANESP